MSFGWNIPEILVGGIATIAIYSFLWRENRFYRFFEHLFIGIGVGLGIVETFKNYMWPNGLKPIAACIHQRASILTYAASSGRAGGLPEQADLVHGAALLLIFPMLFGLLFYTIYSRRHGWMARIAIGFTLGVGGGLAFKGFFAEYLPQIIKSFKPLLVWDQAGDFDLYESFNNLVFFLTLMCVMSYFFFSVDHKLPVIKQTSVSGRWLMMVSFGAFFGATVMARMALLVERLQFLITDWWPVLAEVFMTAGRYYAGMPLGGG